MTMTLHKADLRQFTGSESWYRHPLARSVLYTDGVRHAAEAGGAYWLLDVIAPSQRGIPAGAADEFQVWKLTVLPDHTATLACEEGNRGRCLRNCVERQPPCELDGVRFPFLEGVLTVRFCTNCVLAPTSGSSPSLPLEFLAFYPRPTLLLS